MINLARCAPGLFDRLVLAIACILLGAFSSVAVCADSATEAEVLLDRAADANADLRHREYAARQLLMLADSSASILLSALGDDASNSSALRRQVAARLLGELGAPQAEASLLEAAFGPDYFLSEAAKEALARVYSRLSDGEIYSLLTKGSRARDHVPGSVPPGEDDWLALSLARSRHQGKFKALVMRGLALKYAPGAMDLPQPLTWCVWDALLDADGELRLAAVRMLPRIANPEAVEKLAGFLYTENDAKVLVAALQAMREMRPPEFGEVVERQTRNADPMVALEAFAALDAMGYPGVLFPSGPGGRAVATFVNHPSTPVRRRAIELLTGSKNPAALEFLENALFDRVGSNRALAAKGLGEMGLTAAVGSISPLMRDGRPEVRREAAIALAKLGVVGVASRVVDDLREGALPFRVAAAQALGCSEDGRAVTALLEAANSEEPDLVFSAIDALGALGEKGAGEGVFALMRGTKDAVVRDACRSALRKIYLDDPGDNPSTWEDWSKRANSHRNEN